MKCSCRNISLCEAGHLILHQGNKRGYDESKPRQEGGWELVAQRFSLAGWHNGQRVSPGQHSANDVFLPGTKPWKAELQSERSREIIHGQKRDGFESAG